MPVIKRYSAKLKHGGSLTSMHFSLNVYIGASSQQQALMEASAIAQQIEHIAASIAEDKSNVRPEDRQRALNMLIELRRLEQLKAIAGSASNSTYFFGDKAALGQGAEAFNIDYAEQVKGGLKRRVEGVV
jgi:hypothetical protein